MRDFQFYEKVLDFQFYEKWWILVCVIGIIGGSGDGSKIMESRVFFINYTFGLKLCQKALRPMCIFYFFDKTFSKNLLGKLGNN